MKSSAVQQALRERAHKLIPAGCHTYSKGDDQFPEIAPAFIARGKGSRVWDTDGREFVDWGMGLRSVILGHCFEPVLQAVREQLELGSNFLRPSPIEADFAELLTSLIPGAQMVKFAKNGSDVTTAAVKLSRAYTGRDIVARCQEHPFFSVNDWFIGDTAVNSGVPQAVQDLTKRFRFNDIASLEDLFSEYPGKIACVILEPAATEEPKNRFLHRAQELCRKNGAVFILDEMITGFRWHLRGAQHYYGITPDLATFSMATISFIRDNPVVEHLWHTGRRIKDGVNAMVKEYGLSSNVIVAGTDCSPYMLFRGEDGKDDASIRTLFLQEMVRGGVLIPYIAPSWSHRESELDQTLSAARDAVAVVGRAIEAGNTDGLLVGPPTKPVFRRFN